MRAVVCADLEGIGGVDRFEACFPAWPRAYRRAQELLEGEVTAVVEGLRDAGVEVVAICDWHFAGNNLRRDRIRARLGVPVQGLWVDGTPRMDRTVFDHPDLAVFVGMHGAAGSGAFMAHTFWQGLAVEVDGQPVNEAYLWAVALGAVGARVGLVAGEARVAEECAVLLPGVPVVTVKRTVDRDTARTERDVGELREELRARAAEAARRPLPPPPAGPRTVRVTFYEAAWARRAARRGLGELDGPRHLVTTVDRAEDLIPLVARCTLALPSGGETALYSRLVPAPERTRRPPWLQRLVAGCVHAVGRPLMRRGVVATQRMAQDRYPTAGTDGRRSEPSL